MHLLVLGAFWPDALNDQKITEVRVLMHLLVLGAFWPEAENLSDEIEGLNAPSGAGCFLAGLLIVTIVALYRS